MAQGARACTQSGIGALDRSLTSVWRGARRAAYIDDMPGNIAAATRLGSASHLFSGYDSMREFLREAGAIASA